MTRQTEDTSASLRLDGAALKRLREEQRLTQLYVSKVVGVTTDTVSRWENNRYPTMRRDNALKLAEALEVPLEELLLKPAPPAAPPSPGKNSQLVVIVSLVAAGLAVVLLVLLWQGSGQAPPAAITAERLLPAFAAPRSELPVRINLTRRSEEGGFILREYLPRGWQLLQADPPPSSLDNETGMVRWIIKAGDQRERIVYLARVAGAAALGSSGSFQGEVVAGGGAEGKNAVPVQGDSRVAVAAVLWADQDGDGRIDDTEMLQASHLLEEMAAVKLDWRHLEQLWSAGGYRWNPASGEFLPEARLPAAPPRP